MLLKEYRICMPLTVEEYRIGQLYMIAKHSEEQSQKGEGVHVVENKECYDPEHGKGRFTEKRIYLSSRLPVWSQKFIARLSNYFYVTEKAWNFYPHTITEYSCSFLDKFSLYILSRYENNSGTSENCLGLSDEDLSQRIVDHVDIAYNEVPDKSYREEEDLRHFKSKKTGRGPLKEDWRTSTMPIMCSYKAIKMKFEVWGFQTKVESFAHKAIRDILVLGHRQAFAWIDEWHGMTIDEVRQVELKFQSRTNEKVGEGMSRSGSSPSAMNEAALIKSSSTPASMNTMGFSRSSSSPSAMNEAALMRSGSTPSAMNEAASILEESDEEEDEFEDALEEIDEMSGASGTSR